MLLLLCAVLCRTAVTPTVHGRTLISLAGCKNVMPILCYCTVLKWMCIVCAFRTTSWSDLLISCAAVEEEVFYSASWHSSATCKVCRGWTAWNRCFHTSCHGLFNDNLYIKVSILPVWPGVGMSNGRNANHVTLPAQPHADHLTLRPHAAIFGRRHSPGRLSG